MNRCRCLHPRRVHWATPNALAKKRARRDRRPAQMGCRYGAQWGGRKVCPCRNYVEKVVA